MSNSVQSSQRAQGETLEREIAVVHDSPIVDGLMAVTGGLLAVLNDRRQILAVNEGLLHLLGVENPADVLGLRPGEAINCVHAHDAVEGCGEGPVCMTCGAAIAIVVSLHENRPVERMCAAKVYRAGKYEDMFFKVRASPVHLDGVPHILLFLQECGKEQKRAVLERAFFHDISTIVQGLFGTAELLCRGDASPDMDCPQQIYDLSARLVNEIAIQKRLIGMDAVDYAPTLRPVRVAEVLDELRRMYTNHPAAADRMVAVESPAIHVAAMTDHSLLVRALSNLILNALEATQPGGTVRVGCRAVGPHVELSVWNPGMIPDEVAGRIFQRNFSTKSTLGRGVGTYVSKLFIEAYAGGTVDFVTSAAEGTRFRIRVPAATLPVHGGTPHQLPATPD